MINASAQSYRIWICRPGQDEATGFELTNFCSGDSGGFAQITVQPFDESGIIKVSGQITLVTPPNDARFDTEDSPDWAVGNRIIFKTVDSSGTLRILPVSRLYLLSAPLPPYEPDWTISLEIGDKFSLLDQALPRPAATGDAVVGARADTYSGSRTGAINELLAGRNLSLGVSLPGPGLRDYQKDMRQPLVGQIGELAIGGFASLYLDQDDVIRPVWIGTTPAQRLFKHQIGTDCAGDWEPLQSPIRPANSVEVVAPENATEITEAEANDPSDPRNNPDWDESENGESQKYAGSSKTEIRMSRDAIQEGGGSGEVIAVIRTEQWAWSANRYQSSVEEVRARGLVIPEDLYNALIAQGVNIVVPSPYSMVGALLTTEVRTYEGGDEGRLLKTERTVIKTQGETLAEFYKRNYLPTLNASFIAPTLAEQEVTTYSYQTSGGYDSRGQVREIRTQILRKKGQVAAAANDWIEQSIGGPTIKPGFLDMVVAEFRIQKWRKRSSLEWEQKTFEYRAGQARNGTIEAFTALKLIKGETVSSRNGDLQPPAADRRPARSEDNPRKLTRSWQVRNRVSFGNDDNPRDRIISVNHVPSAAAARTLAELLGKMDRLRERGFRIVTTLRDEWFSWFPLCRIDVQRGNRIYWGVVDSVTFSFSQTQRIVVVDLMRSGRWVADDSAYPFSPLPPLTAITNPTPLYGVTLPDDLPLSQPFVPGVQVNLPIESQNQFGSLVVVLDWEIGIVLIGPNFASNNENGSTVVEVIGPPPNDPLDFSWELDAIPWVDSVGGRTLTAVNVAPIVEGSGDGYTEFYWRDGGGFQQFGHLTSGFFSWTRTSTADWSWYIEFEIWWNDVNEVAPQFTIEVLNEFDMYVMPTELTLNLRNSEYDLLGDFGINTLTLGAAVSSNTWHTIRGEFNATTNQISVRFNAVNSTPSTLVAPLTNTAVSPLVLGGQMGIRANVRLRNFRFYRTELIPR